MTKDIEWGDNEKKVCIMVIIKVPKCQIEKNLIMLSIFHLSET